MHDQNTHLTDEQLSTLLDDRLEAADREKASRHLVQCDACDQSLQELTYAVQALRAMPVPALPRSFQIVQTSKPSFWSRLSGWSIGLQGLAAAAAALFVVLLAIDMTAMASPSSIVPLAPAAQSRAVVGTQKVQPTVVAPERAAPASAGARAAAPPGSDSRRSASSACPRSGRQCVRRCKTRGAHRPRNLNESRLLVLPRRPPSRPG